MNSNSCIDDSTIHEIVHFCQERELEKLSMCSRHFYKVVRNSAVSIFSDLFMLHVDDAEISVPPTRDVLFKLICKARNLKLANNNIIVFEYACGMSNA